jgi:hypothetical protein
MSFSELNLYLRVYDPIRAKVRSWMTPVILANHVEW